MFKVTCPVCRKVHTVQLGENRTCDCGAVWKHGETDVPDQIAGWHKPVDAELTDAEWLRKCAEDIDVACIDAIDAKESRRDAARLRSIAAKLEVLEKYPHAARIIQAEASGKVPEPSDVAEVCSWEIALKYMKAVAKRVGLPEDAKWPDIMAKLERPAVEAVVKEYGGGWAVDYDDYFRRDQLAAILGREPVEGMPVKVTIHPV